MGISLTLENVHSYGLSKPYANVWATPRELVSRRHLSANW
jgi:hypothetical protein